MRQELPWIGYNSRYRYHLHALNESGYRVLPFEKPYLGLDRLKRTHFPMILIQDSFTNTDNLGLPPDLSEEKIHSAPIFILPEIKGMNGYGKVPILLLNIGLHPDFISRFRSAGITDFLDISEGNIDSLVRTVKRLMK